MTRETPEYFENVTTSRKCLFNNLVKFVSLCYFSLNYNSKIKSNITEILVVKIFPFLGITPVIEKTTKKNKKFTSSMH